MPLIRRVIRTEFTEEDIQDIEYNASHSTITPTTIPPSIDELISTPIYSSTYRASHVTAVSPTISDIDDSFTTRSGLRYVATTVPLVVSSTGSASVAITGSFKWPGRRDTFVRQCFTPLHLYLEQRIPYANYLVVANTTGQGKIRTAITSGIRIYSEQEFYRAIVNGASQSNIVEIAQRCIPSALSRSGMSEYIRRV